MKFLHLVWRNLTRKKTRTILTVLSILVAFLLYAMLCAFRQALTGGIDVADAERLVVRHKVSIIQLLPVSYTQRIEGIPGVASAAHLTWFGGIYQDPKNFFASMPVDPEPFLAMYPEYVVSPECKKAWLATRTGAIVGRATAERFGWKVGDRIALRSPIWQRANRNDTWEFDLVGIYDGAKQATDTTGFFFRYDYFDEGRLFAKGQIGWFSVRVRDPQRVAEIVKAIDDEFANSPYETKTEAEGAFIQGWAAQVGDIGAIMIAVLSAVFFTILLVAGNTMAQSVRERIEELGVLKALGFSNGLVLGVVLAESLCLALVGGLTGLGLGVLITAHNPAPGLFPVFYLPSQNIAVGAALIAALGLVAGILPALQAGRLKIADALRRQT